MRSVGGGAIYVPEWEILADALTRVQATGLGAEQAKKSIVWAIADRKIEVRVHCANGWVLEGTRIDVPKRLNPEDFDWPQSRPRELWRRRPTVADHYEDRNVTIDVSLIELRTEDVTRVLCLGTDTAVASTGTTDMRGTTANEVPTIITPTAEIGAEPLVSRSLPAGTPPPGGDAPPGSDMLCESWTYYQAIAYLANGNAEVAARYGGPDNARDGGHSRRGRDLFYPKSSGLPGTEALASRCGDELAAATARWEATDADRWRAAVAKHYQAMLAGSVTAYRGTAAYGVCGLIDPMPTAALGARALWRGGVPVPSDRVAVPDRGAHRARRGGGCRRLFDTGTGGVCDAGCWFAPRLETGAGGIGVRRFSPSRRCVGADDAMEPGRGPSDARPGRRQNPRFSASLV